MESLTIWGLFPCHFYETKSRNYLIKLSWELNVLLFVCVCLCVCMHVCVLVCILCVCAHLCALTLGSGDQTQVLVATQKGLHCLPWLSALFLWRISMLLTPHVHSVLADHLQCCHSLNSLFQGESEATMMEPHPWLALNYLLLWHQISNQPLGTLSFSPLLTF